MKKIILAASFLVLSFAAGAQAVTITFTSSAAFFTALGASTFTTETYESQLVDSIIADGSTVNGITYNSFPANTDGRIDNIYNNIGNQSLALQRGLDNTSFFFPGESMNVKFPFAVKAVGIFFNANATPLNSLQVQTAVGNAGNGAVYDQSTFFFVGLISDTPFNSATFAGSANGSTYNLDNLTYSPAQTTAVPDGGNTVILFLLGSALLGTFALRQRQQRNVVTPTT